MTPAAVKRRLVHFFSQSGPRFLRDLISLAGGQSVSMVLGFCTFAYLARQLAPDEYGMIELAIAVAAFATIMIECGMGPIGVKALAARPGDVRIITSQVTTARFLMALIVIPAVFLLSFAANLPPSGKALMWIFIASLIFAPFKQEWLFQGLEHMSFAAAARPLRSLTFAIGVFLLVRPGTTLQTVGWIECATMLLISIYYLGAQYLLRSPFQTGWPILDALRFLRQGAAVGLSNMLWAFSLFAPMMMLAVLADAAQSAWLGAAQRVVVSLLALGYVYHFNLYPAIARSLHTDLAIWDRVMRASVNVIAWGGVLVALILTLFSRELLVLAFGPAFEEATYVLICLAWIVPLRLLSGHARWSLIAKNAQRRLLHAELAGAVALIGAGLVAIPYLGAVGAAIGFFVAILTSTCMTQIAINRWVGRLSIFTPCLTPMGAALAAVLLWVTGGMGPLAAIAGLCLFLAVALACRKPLIADLIRVAYSKSQEQQAN